ncbi:glycoside hydrolase, partial [Thozetella sp. PMI_491]
MARLIPSVLLLLSAFLGLAWGSEFIAQLQPCPNNCSTLGDSPSNWTYVRNWDRLRACEQPVLFDMSIYNNFSDADSHTTIRACAVGDTAGKVANDSASTGSCESSSATSMPVQVSWAGTGPPISQDRFSSLSQPLRTRAMSQTSCGQAFMLSQAEGMIAGLYAGGSIDIAKSLDAILEPLAMRAMASGLGDMTVVQACGGELNGNRTVGFAISTKGDLASVQLALQTWSNASCVAGLAVDSAADTNVTLFAVPSPKPKVVSRGSVSARDDTCSTVQVVSGDSCGSLAAECGITAAQFTQFNPNPSLCSTLAVGQFVCCSAGSLPDLRPKPSPNGDCATYTVQAGDFCSKIAASNFIAVSDIESFNTQTWGWQGCSNVQLGQIICLSTGNPPFPASVSSAICGPQVPGTSPPSNLSAIADLNPCPLNACCDIFGQCGITDEFCTVSASLTGAPGTSAPGTAGCISNCGTDIVNTEVAPTKFLTVAYWEAFNLGRGCLTMEASQIPDTYTHIHYAFATITSDFKVDVSDTPGAFESFVAATGSFKKIVSFGGWSFSTDVDSFPIFRDVVTPANRLNFAVSIVNFLNQYNLDGVDFDWEYPGAPDIPGIPPGTPDEGANYLEFLITLRSILPAGKTLSLAAPASYWYLRGFPIKDMAPIVDYIVYETYDLHGQWDYNNAFSNPGCPTGNCLRSHVNLTETNYALAMITKAGVPSNKVLVGVTSYGRSFGMVDPSCTGPSCLFTGPDSGALPGSCTATAGYLADTEINDLLGQGGVYFRDADSDSDIAVFQDTWVAYMTPITKSGRIGQYTSANFAGSVDWAVDL